MNEVKLNSAALTQGPSRAPARAMLKAVGFTDEDLRRPLIGVANTWIEIGPCNHHLRELAASVKQGIRAAGGTPMEFNTVSISDGITMGTEGMRTSLVSREVIADSIELVARGNQFDGIVALVGCDKTIPGAIMALARLNLPGLVLYGGSIAPGSFHGKDVTIQDVFEAVGAHDRGLVEVAPVEDHRRLQHARELFEIRAAERLPLGHDDEGVGPARRLHGARGERHRLVAVEDLARLAEPLK